MPAPQATVPARPGRTGESGVAGASCRQMLYVGDGASDLPAFGLVQRHGGLALGVLRADGREDWKVAKRMHARARVENLARADFGDGAPLRQILTLAVEILAKRVALRRLTLDD